MVGFRIDVLKAVGSSPGERNFNPAAYFLLTVPELEGDLAIVCLLFRNQKSFRIRPN